MPSLCEADWNELNHSEKNAKTDEAQANLEGMMFMTIICAFPQHIYE